MDVAVLESDAVRRVLTPRPTYSEEERETFYTALTFIADLLVRHGVPVIVDATANRRAYRAEARAAIARFVEVYVDCPLDVCKARDPKGIYQQAQAGAATTVPGVQAAYEPPASPEVVVSGTGDPGDAAAAILRVLKDRGYVRPTPAWS
jgi:adenylylsulfate kinase